MTDMFDKDLADVLHKSAATIKTNLTLRKGTYFGVAGPQYETPAEIGMIRILGGDSVGMSTVFEVIAAVHSGIKVLGLSLITNRCRGPNDNEPPPYHDEVLKIVDSKQDAIQALVSQFVKDLKVTHLPQTLAAKHFSNITSKL